MKWIKINNDIYDIIDGSVQLSVGSHATIHLILDISKNKSYQDIFIKLYESQQNYVGKDTKFTISNAKFIGSGSMIKSIDTDFNSKMNITIRCDYLQTLDIQERRNGLLNDLID
jgi:hypothetical protein